MPIQLPNLDNKTYDDLMKEMITSIPKYTQEWTNFNPSDPGITMLELLAWIAESLIYRANRIPEESYLNFLRLIAGAAVYDDSDKAHQRIHQYLKDIGEGKLKADMQSMKAEAQRFLNSSYRAVTEDDFKALTMEAHQAIKRVEVFSHPDRVEIIIVPFPECKNPCNQDGLIKIVRDYLKPRQLVCTVVEIKMAQYTPVNLVITVSCESHANTITIDGLVKTAITDYLDSFHGGANGNGWPYKRELMVYELYYIVEKIAGIKHVNSIKKINDAASFISIPVDGLMNLESLKVEFEEKDNE